MKIEGIGNGQIFLLTEGVEYTIDVLHTRMIIGKAPMNVTIQSLDSEHTETECTSSPFDIYIQMLEGHAELMIDLKLISLEIGQSTIIPAYTRNVILTRMGAKVLTTVMPNGHKDEWFI